jgi:hypothetical protein
MMMRMLAVTFGCLALLQLISCGGHKSSTRNNSGPATPAMSEESVIGLDQFKTEILAHSSQLHKIEVGMSFSEQEEGQRPIQKGSEPVMVGNFKSVTTNTVIQRDLTNVYILVEEELAALDGNARQALPQPRYSRVIQKKWIDEVCNTDLKKIKEMGNLLIKKGKMKGQTSYSVEGVFKENDGTVGRLRLLTNPELSVLLNPVYQTVTLQNKLGKFNSTKKITFNGPIDISQLNTNGVQVVEVHNN